MMMPRYKVKWQLNGEAIFSTPDSEDQVHEEIGVALNGIVTDANDNMVEGFQESSLENPMNGIAKFTVRKLKD